MSTVAVNPPKTPCTKGSSGMAVATLPNVCKMPGPPAPFVPTPLPNIGQSGKQPDGYSTTVKVESQPVAIQGASFGSSGDIASKGTGGGIVSNNAEGPTKFIAPGSLDVQIEGKNVQYLGDQMMNNCGPSGSPANSATMTGLAQAPVIVDGLNLTKIACDCAATKTYNQVKNIPVDDWVKCCILGIKRETCVQEAIAAEQAKGKGMNVHAPAGANYGSDKLPKGKAYCRPDIVVGPGPKPLNASAMTQIVDLKFPCNPDGKLPSNKDWSPAKALGKAQRECYEEIKLPSPTDGGPPNGDGAAKAKGVKVTACGPTKEGCAS
jgi:hypothetical protein